jgi:AcrR family transcriptional regulator
MPRAGLDPEVVVSAATAIADRDGLDALTLRRLAEELGVRSPSLYAHVGGLEDLRDRIAVSAARKMARELQAAAAGRAGVDALRAVAAAYRTFAVAHRGGYSSLQNPRMQHEAFDELVGVVLAVLRGYGLEGDDALHGVRIVRAALHGFVALELTGGFGMALDLDETFSRLVTSLDQGLRLAPS